MSQPIDVGLNASVASTATSGLQQDFRGFFGDNVAGGSRSKWLPFVLIASGLIVAILLIPKLFKS